MERRMSDTSHEAEYNAHEEEDPNAAPPISHDAIAVHSGELGHIESPTVDSLRNPAKEGYLMKRGYKLGCIPSWKRRYFVLLGSYIFKFENSTSNRPKGIPIPVLGCTCTIGPVDPATSASAAGHKHTMTLSTLRKEYIIGGETHELLQEWIDAIAQAKALTIKQELGHAPISESEVFANRSGDYLTQRKLDRETQETEESRVGRYEG